MQDAQQEKPGSPKSRSVSGVFYPKGPCAYIVYTWALQLLYGNPFKAPSIYYIGTWTLRAKNGPTVI